MDNPYKLALSPTDPNWPKFIETTEIPGLLISKREIFEDERGFFHEAVELRDFEKVLGKKISITQWNHSRSHPNVIRGFHSEPWEKIIYAVKGNAISVIVDFRIDSPTFGKAVKINIGENDRKTIYVPYGMGNSFCALGKEDVEYMYMITGYFEGKPTPAVSFKDPMITKQFGGWPVTDPIVSEKDRSYPTLKEKFGSEVDFSKFPWLNE
jgi:dTDP-4-dehydrorhamnose 3,5-epimerase